MRETQSRQRDGQASGPFSFLHPTTRRSSLPLQQVSTEQNITREALDENNLEDESPQPKRVVHAEGIHQKWRSRDNRKGRHAITVTREADSNSQYETPASTTTVKATFRGIGRMFTTYPYWDVSYLVAIIFTVGSVVWCINACFVWLPLVRPSSEFPGEIADGGGWTAFIGATIFEFGSILLMIEAVNENRTDCFGWAIEEVLEERGVVKVRPGDCSHHHQNKRSFVSHGKASEGKPEHDTEMESKEHPDSKSARTWTWFPSWYEVKTHYVKELGFLACSFQMFGATIFWISGFTALPKIQEALSTPSALNGAYWAPQVVGGTGFIISGVLFMIETQKKWYLPAFTVLGWHIGAWNLIGGIGFTLCGALGFGASSDSGVEYQASLSTFWASWAFLIGSVIQWYEALDKHPVDIETSGGGTTDA
ncbi:integral membrane protein [Phlyctema vagabunda]|uniref:Integral membrane protein n=1 Tax=Phlyctema vagabunda TaxID=108571 RepID=A0ABR4PMN8_9HELO